MADRPLLAHLKRLNLTASSILGCGFARAARLDPQAVDALLSDVFAVATWRGWPLPIEAEAEQEVIIDGVPRGLLGVDTSPGAGVWRIDHRTLALARQCQAADQADWSSHMLKH